MEIMNFINFLARWGHVLFGITWIGLLYYFNFIQGGYFKQATPEALKDAKAKLAPEALWWFRWGAMFTFITGLILLVGLMKQGLMNAYIIAGATMGTLMFLNVWLIIWPNQKIALGLVQGGDAGAAAGKALLASRTNTLFSGPMVFFMLAGPHFVNGGGYGKGMGLGLWIVLALIAALEVNAIAGKQGPMTTVKGVIHCSIALTVVLAALLVYL
ncbi:urate hydroxylase PuuD [Pseudomaricurvus sp. HS19]|uniref:urate hydroxylase PuuD n=1 Tax=Pseudomaricurvus sp. HS19 TaxID=2692626 RepID=UPI001F3FD976|nr:urate hydroxylase PuuD [Pseudomaricurvus sp. HS19]